METYLVFVNIAANNNKFWSAKIDGNNVIVNWGRIGCQPQEKIHSFHTQSSAQQKFNSLKSNKISKGYRVAIKDLDSTQPELIKQGIRLLEQIKPLVEQRNYKSHFIRLLEEYLKIVPTPVGMKLIPEYLYRNVGDVEHQISILNSLLPNVKTVESKPISLKSIGKNFWRNIVD